MSQSLCPLCPNQSTMSNYYVQPLYPNQFTISPLSVHNQSTISPNHYVHYVPISSLCPTTMSNQFTMSNHYVQSVHYVQPLCPTTMSQSVTTHAHRRMARGGHGLPKVLLRPALPHPSMRWGGPPLQGWLICRVGGLRPSSSPLDTLRCMPLAMPMCL
jgi:hypothetical protein